MAVSYLVSHHQRCAQVAQCYPKDTAGFPAELMQLLDTHSEALDSALRQAAVKALILLRNRGQVSPMEVLPLFFRLFRCRDKALRQMLFSHIVAGEALGAVSDCFQRMQGLLRWPCMPSHHCL